MSISKQSKCPICNKLSTDKYQPFCCKRCADADLGRWLHESYSIPITEVAEEDKVPENLNEDIID